MKEIRLTLATDDFGAISQFLIDRGVEFRVEPVVANTAAADAARAGEKPAGGGRKAAKKTGKRTGRRAVKPTAPSPGASRLREALALKPEPPPFIEGPSSGNPTGAESDRDPR
jgi:hypothetical protein